MLLAGGNGGADGTKVDKHRANVQLSKVSRLQGHASRKMNATKKMMCYGANCATLSRVSSCWGSMVVTIAG